MRASARNLAKIILGTLTGYILSQLGWAFWQLAKADPRFTLLVPQNKAPKGITSLKGKTEAAYTVQHSIETGIERISYFPKVRQFETPLLFQHGMFHGAFCWENWQKLFAEWGWESHAISLPGHGNSPIQRPIHQCTLDYYTDFLRAEVKKMDRNPVILGHSMGGAILQWYLKYCGQPAAAVFVASWGAKSIMGDDALKVVRQDPAIIPAIWRDWHSGAWIRSERHTANLFLDPNSVVSAAELHRQLKPESTLVLLQHNPPFWFPPEKIKSPSLWLAAENDALISEADARRSAAYYAGDYLFVPHAPHNIMMAQNYAQTAEKIRDWLVAQDIR